MYDWRFISVHNSQFIVHSYSLSTLNSQLSTENNHRLIYYQCNDIGNDALPYHNGKGIAVAQFATYGGYCRSARSVEQAEHKE